MELFGVIGWISVPRLVLQYLDLPAENLSELVANEFLYWWITLGVAGALYLSGLIFGGFGLMKLAKRAGIKHGWMGFFPFANTYLAGKLAGEANMFGSRIKHIGLITMIFEIVFVALNIFSIVLQMVVLDVNLLVEVQEGGYVAYSESAMQAAGLGWIYTILHLSILDIINYIFSLVMVFLFCMLFMAFFRKYYARSPFLMTFLCAVLPARGYVLFAVRNNTPFDYNAYMRQRMQQQQQVYGNPYGGYAPPQTPPPPSGPPAPEPYGDEFGGGSGGSGTPPEDPFSDF